MQRRRKKERWNYIQMKKRERGLGRGKALPFLYPANLIAIQSTTVMQPINY
jgi:hypothetical protein